MPIGEGQLRRGGLLLTDRPPMAVLQGFWDRSDHSKSTATLITPQRWRVPVLGPGHGQRDCPATALGVSEAAVSQWLTRAREGGAEALRRRPSPGAPRRLTDEQLACLPAMLHQGPEAYGFRGELWTRGRITAVIRVAFGISYHPRHVGRLCKAIRWSPQKPARRARQRHEAAIAEWRDETWPAIKRGRTPKGNPSSLSTNPDSLPCRVSSAPTRQ